MQESTSDLLRDNCDEFIYYEDLGKAPPLAPNITAQLPETKHKAFALLLESLLAFRRENKEILWSSMVKDTMKRKKPSFNEAYHGYRTFSELLEDAKKEGLLELDIDTRSRTYVVTRFGSELSSPAPTRSKTGPARRRRGRSSAGRPRQAGQRLRREARRPKPAPLLFRRPTWTAPSSSLIRLTLRANVLLSMPMNPTDHHACNVYVNNEDIRYLDSLATPVKAGDEGPSSPPWQEADMADEAKSEVPEGAVVFPPSPRNSVSIPCS